jgi:arginine-tRNA-protein transferase
VLKEIETAAALGIPWLYLGYWIAACPSMTYKNRFAPHEILRAYVGDGEEPDWQPAEADPTGAANGCDEDEPAA